NRGGRACADPVCSSRTAGEQLWWTGGMSMMAKVAVSLLAVSWTALSAAQAHSAEGASEEPTRTPANPGASSVSLGELEEVIVTAQRRSERLVDVPISVAAVSISELERAGATSLESLNKLVP